ncbi:MAG: hypothetical protein WC756_19595 [Taibaiella sp.]|jgi:spore coat polysaccharide biosynthesis protein SpsF
MQNKTIACIIARTVSTRLPIKVLRDLLPNVSMIEFLIKRLQSVERVDDIYICTSKEPQDDIMEDISKRNNIKLYRGSADAVIERMLEVAKIENADYLIRITGDNPLTSIEYLSKQITKAHEHNLDYVRLSNVPIGATAEVMKTEALIDCYKNIDPSVSEYLMLYMFNPDKYKCGVLVPFIDDTSNFSITVDTPDDLLRVKNILDYSTETDKQEIKLCEIVDILNRNLEGLPAKEIQRAGIVKLPYNNSMSFEEFNKDMINRKTNSTQFNLYDE